MVGDCVVGTDREDFDSVPMADRPRLWKFVREREPAELAFVLARPMFLIGSLCDIPFEAPKCKPPAFARAEGCTNAA
jgi:hypothetical protein